MIVLDDRINELMAPLSQYDLSIIIKIFSSVNSNSGIQLLIKFCKASFVIVRLEVRG